jgi:hypothetical protein
MCMKARHPNLSDFPGRYVAIDDATDRVVADAATLVDLWDLIKDRDLNVSIMRAPREDEPVLVGLG